MTALSRPASKLMLAGAASLIALAAPTGVAQAAQSKTLTYQCKYPLLGIKKLSVKIDLDIPNVWPAGQPTAPFRVTATASAYDMRAGLQSVDGLDAIAGGATAFATVKTAQGFTVPAKVNATINKTKLARPIPEPLVLLASGETPALTFDDPGTERISLDRLAINLTALDAEGRPIVLAPVIKDLDGNPVTDSDGNASTFDVYCKLDAGQDTSLATFEIVDDPSATPIPTPVPTPTAAPTPTLKPPAPGPVYAHFDYKLAGSTTINTLTKGTMPLAGSISAQLDVATGKYTAETVLNDTQGRLTSLGFLPVTVAIAIIPSGPTTGELIDDQITASLKARIKVKSAKVFGAIPLFTENTCQTKQLTQINLKSTGPFDPTRAGGDIGGVFAIGDLNGCGLLGGLVSPLTAGGGNTIAARLTPVLD